MLAGAAGIDMVLRVISTEEGVKPETREHFAICSLLGVRRGLAVLTKADAVSPESWPNIARNLADAQEARRPRDGSNRQAFLCR
jgi:selenocysteine-specific elongation factor